VPESTGCTLRQPAERLVEALFRASQGVLRTGAEKPYYQTNQGNGLAFRIALQRDKSGNCTQTTLGFRFQSTLYRRTGR